MIMDKGKFYNGLFIMIGLVVLGMMIPRAVDRFRSFDRTVNVKGLCEKEVKADKVIWPVVYRYDLMGRPVANPTRGIYVKDGRKVVIGQ